MFYVKWYENGSLQIRQFNTYEKALAKWDTLNARGIQAFIQKPSYTQEDVMKIEKAEKRDKKRNKRNKMVVDNKSIFTIVSTLVKKGEQPKSQEE